MVASSLERTWQISLSPRLSSLLPLPPPPHPSSGLPLPPSLCGSPHLLSVVTFPTSALPIPSPLTTPPPLFRRDRRPQSCANLLPPQPPPLYPNPSHPPSSVGIRIPFTISSLPTLPPPFPHPTSPISPHPSATRISTSVQDSLPSSPHHRGTPSLRVVISCPNRSPLYQYPLLPPLARRNPKHHPHPPAFLPSHLLITLPPPSSSFRISPAFPPVHPSPRPFIYPIPPFPPPPFSPPVIRPTPAENHSLITSPFTPLSIHLPHSPSPSHYIPPPLSSLLLPKLSPSSAGRPPQGALVAHIGRVLAEQHRPQAERRVEIVAR